MNEINTTKNALLEEIRNILRSARKNAYSAVNTAMVQAYWMIGKTIVEHELNGNERAEYGKATLQSLSASLSEEFGKGFSVRTLQQMKKFYCLFPNTNALRSQLNWTHYRSLLRVDDENARNWYI